MVSSRSRLGTDLRQLAQAVNLPVLLSNPISGLRRPSNPPASPSNPLRLSSDRILRFCLPTQPPTLHRVSRPPTSPSSQPPTFIGHRPSGSPLRLTSGFHRRRIFGLSLDR